MKDQLVFDISDAASIADSDQVGAVVQGTRAGAKQLIDSQEINSLEWLNTAAALFASDGVGITQTGGALDVNIASPIVVNVDIDGKYDVGTNPNPDSAGLIAHDRTAAPDETDQNQRPTAGGLGTIASASLANVHALDVNSFMYALDDVSGDAELLSKDGTSNGLNVHLAGSDITISVSDAALGNVAVAHAANTLAVADTPEDVVASPLANRKYLWISNQANTKIFIGATGVDEASGFPVSPGSVLQLRAGPAVDIEFVGQSGKTPEIRTLELS
jgi:hypothetical protein